MSLRDESTLRQIEKDCTAVSEAMLSFPFMIPGTRYYKGIKVQSETLRYRHQIYLYKTIQRGFSLLLSTLETYILINNMLSRQENDSWKHLER